MALGGGSFTVQNKELPGAYINFVSAASASPELSARGLRMRIFKRTAKRFLDMISMMKKSKAYETCSWGRTSCTHIG